MRREMDTISRRKCTRHVGAVPRHLHVHLVVVAESRGVEVAWHRPMHHFELWVSIMRRFILVIHSFT